jgi:nucleoside-diphosphate-sugar epimerase
MSTHVLITGADGYLGRMLARRYLEAGKRPVVLWVRAGSSAELATKRRQLADLMEGFAPEVCCVGGDLEDERPFSQVDPSTIAQIVHGAAITRFGVDSDTADRINVAGTRKLLDFAGRCPDLERVGVLSTLYASGLVAGPLWETLGSERPEFANHYERSKWEAEAMLRRSFERLPWCLFRLATVIADDESGTVTQHNAIHNTLRLLYYGLLPLVPGDAHTPVYFVTARFAVDAIFELMNGSGRGRVYHVAHACKESATLGEVVDVVYDTFAEDESFRRRRILKPLYADLEAFRLLADGARAFSGEIMNQALSSIAPFATQLFVRKEIRNEELVSALGRHEAPDPRQLVRTTCARLVRTRWGRSTDHAD